MNVLLCATDVCVPCPEGVDRPGPHGGLPECGGVPAVGFHPAGHRLHPALPHCHLPLPVHPLPPRLQGTAAVSAHLVTTAGSDPRPD